MIHVKCFDGIKETNVLELTKSFEVQCREDINLEVRLEGSRVRAVAGGVSASAEDSVVSRAAKLAAYRALSRATGETLPWGALTGVKPLKLMHRILEEGLGKDASIAKMQKLYEVSKEKSALLYECAVNQKNLLYPMSGRAGLYLNIPLCPTKCSYCSFPSGVTEEGGELCENYLNALLYELERISKFACNDYDFDTVYIGGGTPSILSVAQLERLLEKINETAPRRTEFTCEAGRCDTLNPDKLRLMKQMGVSRISLNPQTTKNETLKAVGRSASYEDFMKVYDDARNTGFEDINCDLIIGLTGESAEDAWKSLSDVAKLSPAGISIHSLCKKRTSEASIDDIFASDINASDFQDEARAFLKGKGYYPYYLYRQKFAINSAENIGYAKEVRMCVYNIRMMGETETIFSAGANSTTKLYFPGEKCFESVFSPKEIGLYIRDIERLTDKKLAAMEKIAARHI